MCYIVNTEGCHLQNLFSDPKTVCRLVWSGTITFMLTTAKESQETWDLGQPNFNYQPKQKTPTYLHIRRYYLPEMHPERAIPETCNLWDIWSEWCGHMTWPTNKQWQRAILKIGSRWDSDFISGLGFQSVFFQILLCPYNKDNKERVGAIPLSELGFLGAFLKLEPE